MAKKMFKVPILENGETKLIDNYEWEGEMTFTGFDGFKRPRFVDGKGNEHRMFMSDFERLLTTKPMNNGKVIGLWTFTKRGSSYAVKLA